MNIRECENLKEIRFSEKDVALMRRLNISSCMNLRSLYIHRAPNFEDINITECSDLEDFDSQRVPLIKIVDLSSLPLLDYIWCLWCPNFETIKMAESGYRDLHQFAIIDTAIRSVDLSKCPKIDGAVAIDCPNLELFDLSGCSALRKFWTYVTGEYESGYPKAEIRLPLQHSSGVLFGLREYAFGKDEASWCKKVFVANERIKQKVIKTGYPENRIEIYQP